MATDHPAGTPAEESPLLVRSMQRLEQTAGLDRVVRRLAPASEALLRSPARRNVLQGTWLGHAVHPILTDLPLGLWTSTTVLDLLGGRRARPAAQLLLGLGVGAAVPAAVTGFAEWGSTAPRERRVGVVHAAANSAGLGLYAGSFLARRRGHHRTGVLMALAGGAAAAIGGYLGGHLIEVRKVSSRHPVFEGDVPVPPPDLY